MRIKLLLLVVLALCVIIDDVSAGRDRGKKKKEKAKAHESADAAQGEEAEEVNGGRRQKGGDEKKEKTERDRERERKTGEKKEKSSSEEDDKDDKKSKNATAVEKKALLRRRRTQTGDKVEVKIDEHTRARLRRNKNPKVSLSDKIARKGHAANAANHRMVQHRNRRHELSRAGELNDGKQTPLSSSSSMNAKNSTMARRRRNEQYKQHEESLKARGMPQHGKLQPDRAEHNKQLEASLKARGMPKHGKLHPDHSDHGRQVRSRRVRHSKDNFQMRKYHVEERNLYDEDKGKAKVQRRGDVHHKYRLGYAARHLNPNYEPTFEEREALPQKKMDASLLTVLFANSQTDQFSSEDRNAADSDPIF